MLWRCVYRLRGCCAIVGEMSSNSRQLWGMVELYLGCARIPLCVRFVQALRDACTSPISQPNNHRPITRWMQVALSSFMKGEMDPIQIFSTKKTLKNAAKHLPVGTIVKVHVGQVDLAETIYSSSQKQSYLI